MRLSELLFNFLPLNGSSDPVITHITDDSREVQPGSLFLAYPGLHFDGRQFIPQALEQGAAAVVYEAHEAAGMATSPSIPILPLSNLQKCCGHIAARFYGNPSAQMTVIGVTGTNGKTSCTHYLAQILAQHQQVCAISGTLGHGFLPDLQVDQHTTSGAINLQRNLAAFLNQGASTVAMEVSSHSLVQSRVAGLQVKIAVLTQLSRDHLDYHGSMEAYAAAKAQLFALPDVEKAVLNYDDAFGQQLIKQHGERLKIVTYSAQGRAHPNLPSVIASNITTTARGFNFQVHSPWGNAEVVMPLLGKFNISNVLAVLSVLGLLEMPFASIISAVATLQSVKGRMQQFGNRHQPQVVVDFAHTPDALAQALRSLRDHQPRRLWCVFGCGGDRDRGKRPLMAQLAEQYADHVVITNDNPRTELPTAIVADIRSGCRFPEKVIIEYDRAAAIHYAIHHAEPGDVILVAGKGHETYQIIGEEQFAFSDQEQVQKSLDSYRYEISPL